MNDSRKIAKWLGWKAVPWDEWWRFVNDPADKISVPCIVEGASPSVYDDYTGLHIGEFSNGVYRWYKPLDAISYDAAIWHQYIFPAIKDRGLVNKFSNAFIAGTDLTDEYEGFWAGATTTPRQLTAVLVRIIGE